MARVADQMPGGLDQAVAPARAIEVLTKDLLNDAGNGQVTATVGANPTLHRDDGSPAQNGDVLSVQPDGTLQARPKGTRGAFEVAVVTGAGLVYRPLGTSGRSFLVPLVTDWPNK